MLFENFRQAMFETACFNTHQIKLWKPDFDNENLVRWNKAGYIIKLRNGFYTFPDYENTPGFDEYIANRIYKPSYISLQYAMRHYNLIPEAVFFISSVSSLNTTSFSNAFGKFTYKKIKQGLMFGYVEKPFLNRAINLATLEKAILDFFYLFSYYNTEKEMEELRFDQSVLNSHLNKDVLFSYLREYNNKNLENRIQLMIKTYQL